MTDKNLNFFNAGDVVQLKSSPNLSEYYWVVIKMEDNDENVRCIKDILNAQPIEYVFPYDSLKTTIM